MSEPSAKTHTLRSVGPLQSDARGPHSPAGFSLSLPWSPASALPPSPTRRRRASACRTRRRTSTRTALGSIPAGIPSFRLTPVRPRSRRMSRRTQLRSRVEPTDDPEGRAAPFVEPEAPGTPDEAPVRPLEGTPPNAPPAPGLSTEPPTDGVTPESAPAPLPSAQGLLAEPGSGPRRKPGLTAVIRVEPSRSELRRDIGRTPVLPAKRRRAAPREPAQATDLTRPVAVRSRTTDKARFHVVQPGESLWTIAENLLGAGSSATNIAAEVARLWELNRERIPSGDPDLIAVGQQLRLR